MFRLLSTFAALLACVWLVVMFAARPEPDYRRTPVLMVHGHGLQGRDWRPLIDHLKSEGYPPQFLHAIDLVPSTGSNVLAAEKQIAPAVERLLAAAREACPPGAVPPEKVALVGHSMGAVSARWYAARIRPERVETLIAVAGANHGTNALCGHAGDGAREMCPAFADGGWGNVQGTLNGAPGRPADETPYGIGPDRPGIPVIPADAARRVLYFSIRLDPDAWIVPAASALLDGAGGRGLSVPSGIRVRETSPGNFLFEEAADHDSILRHPGFFCLIAAMLRRGQEN